jgi:hypothetical protein
MYKSRFLEDRSQLFTFFIVIYASASSFILHFPHCPHGHGLDKSTPLDGALHENNRPEGLKNGQSLSIQPSGRCSVGQGGDLRTPIALLPFIQNAKLENVDRSQFRSDSHVRQVGIIADVRQFLPQIR